MGVEWQLLQRNRVANSKFVIPAQAGIQKTWPRPVSLDPGLRRDDGHIFVSKCHSEQTPIFRWMSDASPHFSSGGEMIAQIIGFTRHLLKEWNNSVYFRLKKRSCGFKDQARARQSGEKWGLGIGSA